MAKKRIDLILTEKGFYESRQKAQAAIMAGLVKIGDKIIDKPGFLVDESANLNFSTSETDRFVSRGGLKMEKALLTFKPDVIGKIFLDIGASTGGFTDCLLQNGVSFVYAIDVGYGQLDWKLRQDNRVKVIERCNARYLQSEDLYEGSNKKADAAVIDVSFISLEKIIPNLLELLDSDFYIIALIKPQFEAGRANLTKGVVKDPEIHLDVLKKINFFLENNGLSIHNLTYSPVKGPSGNIEFLALIKKHKPNIYPDFAELVNQAQQNL